MKPTTTKSPIPETPTHPHTLSPGPQKSSKPRRQPTKLKSARAQAVEEKAAQCLEGGAAVHMSEGDLEAGFRVCP